MTTEPVPPRAHLPRFSPQVLTAALVLLIAIAFWPLVGDQFVNYDDPGYVTRNAMVQQGLSSLAMRWAFTSREQGNYHPVTWLSHELDCALFGLDPRFHHAMNILYHALTSALLFAVFFRLTGAMWRSFMVAAIFALHPLHVESVAWISERKDLLAALMWVATIGAYLRYRATGRGSFYLATSVLFIIGLLAKPMLVTLPFVLLLLDYWPLQSVSTPPDVRRRVLEKLPWILLSCLFSAVVYWVQQTGGSMVFAEETTFTGRLLNAAAAYGKYIVKSIVPFPMAVLYPYPKPGEEIVPGLLSMATLAAISFAVWRMRSSRPYLLVGWLWFLGTLVPVIGFVQVGLQAMADRYMYLPIIGLSVMAVWGIADLIGAGRRNTVLLFSAGSVVITLMAAGSLVQGRYWKDSITLFEHALAVTSDNTLAQTNLGAALEDSGRHAEALVHLQEAVRLRPNEVLIRRNLARTLASLGRIDDALGEYSWMRERMRPDPALEERMGDLLAGEGRTDDALGHYRTALALDSLAGSALMKIADICLTSGRVEEARQASLRGAATDPARPWPHNLLGEIAGRNGRFGEAEKEFRGALALDSTYAPAWNNLGILADRAGRGVEAEAMFARAVRCDSTLANAQFNLGTAAAMHNRLGEAEMRWKKSLGLDPRTAGAAVNLGRLYTMQGRFGAADAALRQALSIDSLRPDVHFNLGALLEKRGDPGGALAEYRTAVRLAPGYKVAADAAGRLERSGVMKR